MTALVTGATGFLGRHLVDRLRGEGLAVRVLARPSARLSFADQSSIEVIPGDMRDPSSLERAVAGVDTVFHLAAATSGDWDEYVETTVLGTRRLLQACVDGGVRRFIYTSSLSIYDLRRRGDTDLVDEFCPLESRPEARA